jgi:hypothetical protein
LTQVLVAHDAPKRRKNVGEDGLGSAARGGP